MHLVQHHWQNEKVRPLERGLFSEVEWFDVCYLFQPCVLCYIHGCSIHATPAGLPRQLHPLWYVGVGILPPLLWYSFQYSGKNVPTLPVRTHVNPQSTYNSFLPPPFHVYRAKSIIYLQILRTMLKIITICKSRNTMTRVLKDHMPWSNLFSLSY